MGMGFGGKRTIGGITFVSCLRLVNGLPKKTGHKSAIPIEMLWEDMAKGIEYYEIKIPGRLLRVSKLKADLKVTPS